MNLILWRHAKAEELSGLINDDERRLTAKGQRQAALMAKWLRPRLPDDARILVSPAQRTRETADALALPYQIETRLAQYAGLKEHLELCREADKESCIVLVGHQPTLGQLASSLLYPNKTIEVPIEKAAIWWLQSNLKHSPAFSLKAAITPGLV